MITRVQVFRPRGTAPILNLGPGMASDDPIQIRDISGLGPVKADIITTPSGVSRGEARTGSSVGKRNPVLTLGFNPDWSQMTLSALRQQLYAYFMPEQWCKLRFVSDELPTVDIEGYVESVEPNMFSQDPEMQVSIICPRPDFVDIDATIYQGVVDDGTTGTVVNYAGTVSSGLELRVDRSVVLPAYSGPVTITVENDDGIKTVTVDPVTINTEKSYKMSSVHGKKRVQNEAIVDGAVTNLLKNFSGKWPELQPGENTIFVQADTPGQNWTLAFFNRFGGL